MNRAMRVIVPLVLAVLLLFGTGWYFLVYDQAFTKDLLLQQARNFEEDGNYKASTFLYNLAYRQSHEEDSVAIELAEQYLAVGNYTKAEYTLSQAIASNPTAKLYMRLSQVYVEQDKLLDAVNMLDSLEPGALLQELEALRPAAPVLTPGPGFYSTYLTVEADDAPGRLCISPDGDYPSIATDLDPKPITLSTGETVIYALRIADNGLVSPLTVHGYTVGGVIEEVEFTDPAVEAALRGLLEVDEDDVVMTDQLWVITDFTVPVEARSLEDLAYLPYLTTLTLEAGCEGDLTVLSALNRLENLTIRGINLNSEIMDIIAAKTGLKSLCLPSCGISTAAPLRNLKDLEVLDLTGNTIRNLEPLSGLTKLKKLLLGNNAVTTVEDLAQLTELEVLDVSFNSLTTLSPIFNLNSPLRELRAGDNQLANVLGIASLSKLEILDLQNNQLTDVKMLGTLTALTELNLAHNAITGLEELEKLAVLRLLNVSYNAITELPPFYRDCQLVSIDLSHNQVSSLEPLKGLPWLNTVNADYNPELEDLLPLNDCPVLIKVNAYGTKVTLVSFLTAKSIIVNFDPTLEN